MKNQNKLLLLILGAGLAVAPSLLAQNPGGRPPRGEHGEHREERGKRMAEELGLSADQQSKIKQVNQQEKAAMEALRADDSLTKEQRRAKAKEIHRTYADQRQALLTPEQKKKADEMREKARERAKEHRKDHEGGQPEGN